MPTMPKELPAIVLNLQCFFTGFASLKTSTQTIKHPYCYLPDLATILQTQDLLPWLAPCGGSKAPVAVRTSSHALCSSSHRNHSMHPHMGLLCREKHRHHDIACSLSILIKLLDLAPFPDWLSSSHGSVKRFQSRIICSCDKTGCYYK